MALIQKRAKMNDFLVASKTAERKPKMADVCRTVLIRKFSNVGSHMGAIGKDDHIYVYHATKVRAKFKKVTPAMFKSGPRKGEFKDQIKAVKVNEKAWTMRVFAVPADRVKAVTQHTNHFVLELK